MGMFLIPYSEVRSPAHQREEVREVKKWFVLVSAAAATAVCVALLAGKDDIRRFRRMHSM
jgi:hypothetical protein